MNETARDEDSLTALPADEVARFARPLRSDNDLALDGVTDEEWEAFDRAISDC